MLKISDAAIDLIIAEEVTDAAYYRKKYQNFDWPKGASGPTVGIGYDCGYVKVDECRLDWAGLIPDTDIDVLVEAVGKTGQAAGRWVAQNKKRVVIPYDVAHRQFVEREMPKWIARLERALPNTFDLHEDCAGALLSIAYNRGTSFSSTGDRFREMRAIKDAMRDRRFEEIPAQIRSMARLWTGGVHDRRLREAVLFEQGLAAMQADSYESPRDVFSADREVERPEPFDKPRTNDAPLVKSKSVKALLWAKLAAVGAFLDAKLHWVASLFSGVPDITSDVSTQLDATKSMIGLFGDAAKDVLDGRTMITLSVVLIFYAIYRRALPRGA